MANQFLGLSLFVVLLSFFIVLNSLSSYDESKAKPVINSIIASFSSHESDEVLEPNVVDDPAKSYREGDALDRLESLFQAQISGTKIRKNRFGTEMYVRVPLEQFEEALAAELSPVQNSESSALTEGENTFLPVLVSVFASMETIPYQMNMVLNTQEPPHNLKKDSPALLARKIRQVSGFAGLLEAAGMPKHLVTAGVGQGEEGYMDLHFIRYEPLILEEKSEEAANDE